VHVEGLAVIVSEIERAVIEELNASGIPVVFLDVGSPRRNISTVRVDYLRGIRRVAEVEFGIFSVGISSGSVAALICWRNDLSRNVASRFSLLQAQRRRSGKHSARSGRALKSHKSGWPWRVDLIGRISA
jgi:hypothetical protein